MAVLRPCLLGLLSHGCKDVYFMIPFSWADPIPDLASVPEGLVGAWGAGRDESLLWS